MVQINNFSSNFLSPLETGIYFLSSHIAASLPRYQTQSLWADVSILLGHHLPHHLILSLLLLLSSFSPPQSPLSPPPSCPSCLKHLCQLSLSLPLSSSLSWNALLTSLHLSFTVSSSSSSSSSSSWSARREAYCYRNAHNHRKQQTLIVYTLTCELHMQPGKLFLSMQRLKYVNHILIIQNKQKVDMKSNA